MLHWLVLRRTLTLGVSCALNLGMIVGLLFAFTHRTTVLPVELVMLEEAPAPEPPRQKTLLRGGTVGIDGSGRIYATWYTEGRQMRPDLLFATSDDGRRFGAPRRLHTSATSIPDHARMAVDQAGRAAIVWEDSTAVRRRVLLRYTTDGGRTLSPIQTLSTAIKSYEPDVATAADGSFVVAWHEEQFPYLKTVVQTVRVTTPRAK